MKCSLGFDNPASCVYRYPVRRWHFQLFFFFLKRFLFFFSFPVFSFIAACKSVSITTLPPTPRPFFFPSNVTILKFIHRFSILFQILSTLLPPSPSLSPQTPSHNALRGEENDRCSPITWTFKREEEECVTPYNARCCRYRHYSVGTDAVTTGTTLHRDATKA